MLGLTGKRFLDADSNIVRLPNTASNETARANRSPGIIPRLHEVGRAARVDDCLLERHELRERLSTLLDSVPPTRRPSGRVVKAIAQQAHAAGNESARALVDLYLEEKVSRRQDVARRVLEGLPRPLVESAVEQALASCKTSASRRKRLECLSAALAEKPVADAPARFVPPMQIQYTAAELVEAFLEALEEAHATEPEAVGLVWLRGFRGLPDNYRAHLLRAVAERRDPSMIPVLEIEAHNTSVEVRRAVAESLPHFKVREALDLALRLEFDQDVMVRYDAARAVEQLRKLKRLPLAVPAPVFDRCFCMAVPGAGSAGILYAVRTADGSIKFCSLLLDTWHRGIVEAWGNVGCDDSELAEVVLAFSSEVVHSSGQNGASISMRRPHFTAISRNEAVELIRSSVAVSRARGRRLPAEFPVWERLFRYEVEDEPSCVGADRPSIVDEFVFDLHCAACNHRIYVNRTRTNLSVSAGYAFCSRCLSKERECARCGRAYRLGSVSAKRILAAFDDSTCTRCICKESKATHPA